MLTPGELKKIADAVADLLSRDSNTETSAEELAMEVSESIVSLYEEIQAKSYNLVIVSSFRLPDGGVHTAAVGPLSTRAKQRARDMGERFAWDYKTRTGEGKYTLVPLVRDPREAWDEARRDQLQAIRAAALVERGALSLDPYGPACVCGLNEELACPRHPKGGEP